MAGMTFEAGLKGIEPTAECLSYQWADGVSTQVSAMNDISQDNFYNTDSGTISDAILKFQEIDKEIINTNWIYELDQSKKALMAEIIDLTTEFKGLKTGIEPSVLQQAMGLYNDNLELAQKAFYNLYLVTLCESYNGSDSRFVLSYQVRNSKTGSYREVQVGYWAGDSFQTPGFTLTSDESIVDTKYDQIDISSCGSAQENLDGCNANLRKELSKRGIKTDDLPPRPGDTR